MARWMKPTEELPNVECGDRILLIVREREHKNAPLTNRLVILEATETGWDCDDPTYCGYTPHDSVLWAHERDVCGIADAVC